MQYNPNIDKQVSTSQGFFIPNMSRCQALLDSYNVINKGQQTKNQQITKQIAIINDTDDTQLQVKLSKLQTELKKLKQNLNVLFDQNQDQIYQQSILQQWQEQKSKMIMKLQQQNNAEKQKLMKNFEEKVKIMEKQIDDIFEKHKNMKKQWNKKIANQTQDLREIKDITLKRLEKCKVQRFQKIRTMNKNLCHKINQLRKEDSYRKINTFAKIQQLKSNFILRIHQQEAKRQQKTQILNKLLKKTCRKAEQSLRKSILI